MYQLAPVSHTRVPTSPLFPILPKRVPASQCEIDNNLQRKPIKNRCLSPADVDEQKPRMEKTVGERLSPVDHGDMNFRLQWSKHVHPDWLVAYIMLGALMDPNIEQTDVSQWFTADVSRRRLENVRQWSTADVSHWYTADVSLWSVEDVSHSSKADVSHWSTANVSHLSLTSFGFNLDRCDFSASYPPSHTRTETEFFFKKINFCHMYQWTHNDFCRVWRVS